MKLLITHKAWNATEVRKIIREPEVCRAHPVPTEAERIWVCERNVPPIGSWMLNYTAMEDQDLSPMDSANLQQWKDTNASKVQEEQVWDTKCG